MTCKQLFAAVIALFMVHDVGHGSLTIDGAFTVRERAIIEHAFIEWASVTPGHELLSRQNIDVVACPDIPGKNFAGAYKCGTVCLFREGVRRSSDADGGDDAYDVVFTHVIMHELGHAHGLDHAPDTVSSTVMARGWSNWSSHLTDADAMMVAMVGR